MGDIPLWPFFLSNYHPNKRDLEMLPTMEAQQAYAVNIIIPLIKQHLSSIRTNTSNGLRKYASLRTPVDSWLKKWAPQVDVKGFWQNSMSYKAPSYGTGGPGASPYAPAPPSYPSAPPPAPALTLRNGPYQNQGYRVPVHGGPSLPDALTIRAAAHGIDVATRVAGEGVVKLGDSLAGVPAIDCVPSCDLPDCGCTVVGGRRKNKRKTVRRRRCKKRTRKNRRV